MKVTTRIERTGIALMPSMAEKAIAERIGPLTSKRIDIAKQRLRDDTRGALGARMANTWRGKVYPVARPTRSLNPAGLVTSNASTVVAAFDPGGIVKAKGASFMAIPTDDVPKAGRAGKRMTPVEVEAAFNQEMEMVPSLMRPNVFYLVLTARRGKRGVRQIRAKSARGFWKQAQRIIMFVLVKQVRLKPLLNWRRIIASEQAAYEAETRTAVAMALRFFGAAA